MKSENLDQANNPLLQSALKALQRAALRARETARQNKTALVVEQDGKIVLIDPDQDNIELNAVNKTP